jgi:hypothetical protein
MLSTAQLVLGVILTLVSLPYGLFAVAISYVARAYLTLPLQVWLLHRVSGIGPRTTLAAVGAPLAASTVMGVALFAGLRALERAGISNFITLATLVPLGVALYAAVLLAVGREWRTMILGRAYRLRKARI